MWSPSSMPQECTALTMVTSISPTFCVPPLFIALVPATPFDSSQAQSSKIPTTCGLNFFPNSTASAMWSKWPWVTSMVSMRSNFLSFSGHIGLVRIQGSMRTTLPSGVWMRKAAWSSHVSLFPRVLNMMRSPRSILMLDAGEGQKRRLLSGLRRSRAQSRPKSLLKLWPGPAAQKESNYVPVFSVKHGLRHGAFPLRIDAVIKAIQVDSWLLPVVRKARRHFHQEPADQIHVRLVVHVDSDDFDPLRFELLSELNHHGIFITARFAPGRPEIHNQRLAA